MNNYIKRYRKYIIFFITIIGLIIFFPKTNYLSQIQKKSNDPINEDRLTEFNAASSDENKTILQDPIRQEIESLTLTNKDKLVETKNKYGGNNISFDGKVMNVTVATRDRNGKITIQEHASPK